MRKLFLFNLVYKKNKSLTATININSHYFYKKKSAAVAAEQDQKMIYFQGQGLYSVAVIRKVETTTLKTKTLFVSDNINNMGMVELSY